jgi:Nucleotide modification associated domain 2
MVLARTLDRTTKVSSPLHGIPMRPRLFSYVVRHDTGLAPNPFWGVCTLALCKPGIRRAAREGDWIVGLGSKAARAGDLSGRVVFAMRVTKKMSLEDYDAFARESLPEKIPVPHASDLPSRFGDAQYDYRFGSPVQRPGAHGPANRASDLSGRFALLSDDFAYFGRRAVPLPPSLRPIGQVRRGHRSAANDAYADAFVSWFRSLDSPSGPVPGTPAEWESDTFGPPAPKKLVALGPTPGKLRC